MNSESPNVVCGFCRRRMVVEFTVSDEVWKKLDRNKDLCIQCLDSFTRNQQIPYSFLSVSARSWSDLSLTGFDPQDYSKHKPKQILELFKSGELSGDQALHVLSIKERAASERHAAARRETNGRLREAMVCQTWDDLMGVCRVSSEIKEFLDRQPEITASEILEKQQAEAPSDVTT